VGYFYFERERDIPFYVRRRDPSHNEQERWQESARYHTSGDTPSSHFDYAAVGQSLGVITGSSLCKCASGLVGSAAKVVWKGCMVRAA